MGARVSREIARDGRWWLCIRIKRIIVRSDSGQEISIRYVTQPSVHGQPWTVITEDTIDRWKKTPGPNFEAFPVCTKKTTVEQKWYTVSCYDARQDNGKSSILYQLHGTARHTFLYDTSEVLEKTINDAELQSIIPSTGGYVAFYLIHTTLSSNRQGLIVLYHQDTGDVMYFFVEKALPFEPRGLSVSPDTTMTCLLISRTSDSTEDYYEVQVYSKRPVAFEKSFTGASFELEYEIPGLKPNRGYPQIMFDPRYYSSRLGIINVSIVQNIRVTHYFMVYDLKAHRAVTMPNENYVSDTDELDLLHADYSPDGTWVHALVGQTTPEVSNKYMRSVWIINSNTLEIVRAIDIGSDNVTECATNFLPIFSKCCRKMALRHRKSVKVYQLPYPGTLRGLCRSVLLRKKLDIDRLAIPETLRNFLKFKAYLA